MLWESIGGPPNLLMAERKVILEEGGSVWKPVPRTVVSLLGGGSGERGEL